MREEREKEKEREKENSALDILYFFSLSFFRCSKEKKQKLIEEHCCTSSDILDNDAHHLPSHFPSLS